MLEVETGLIRICNDQDFGRIYEIINDAAQVYQQIIPAEHWENPYMSEEKLKHEIASGITFWGYQDEAKLLGVMGIQPLGEVTLIRHAYVHSSIQHHGIGGQLLTHLCNLTDAPILIGTWAKAYWAVGFYQKYGFNLVPEKEMMGLLCKYWTASKWHMEMSVVLADGKWFDHHHQMGDAK
jgi:N-acetylglutamate synthase and related acetyltransferases